MSEELQQKLRTQLWTVANNLRGNMSANEFMYFSLGFIFYKYLSEKNMPINRLKMTKLLSKSYGTVKRMRLKNCKKR